ncbi:hypothetical protein SASPL_123696 [Salvia splendens]|uniref:Uncharacterized protein n=1 Tax=Salvia splendens TaxID=180675 RepID=A0A8X8XQB8_SALSN|nr:hypothetical protein SASPL_123696 [Salvia splendens]
MIVVAVAVAVAIAAATLSTSCTKVALDFVSPENISACFKLTEEFRLLPLNHRAKEDKLEVKKMLLHALKSAVDDVKENKPSQPTEEVKSSQPKSSRRKAPKPGNRHKRRLSCVALLGGLAFSKAVELVYC